KKRTNGSVRYCQYTSLIDDEQFDETNIVRGLPVPGGRLGIKITELECA
ncbi:hypothetical protein ACPWC5_004490, partial [Shigella flexneri]